MLLKTQPEVDSCSNCQNTFTRKKLMVCNRCKLAQYCSVECLRGHWLSHRDTCKRVDGRLCPSFDGAQKKQPVDHKAKCD